MTIKELKELIKDLQDDALVVSGASYLPTFVEVTPYVDLTCKILKWNSYGNRENIIIPALVVAVED